MCLKLFLPPQPLSQLACLPSFSSAVKLTCLHTLLVWNRSLLSFVFKIGAVGRAAVVHGISWTSSESPRPSLTDHPETGCASPLKKNRSFSQFTEKKNKCFVKVFPVWGLIFTHAGNSWPSLPCLLQKPRQQGAQPRSNPCQGGSPQRLSLT